MKYILAFEVYLAHKLLISRLPCDNVYISIYHFIRKELAIFSSLPQGTPPATSTKALCF